MRTVLGTLLLLVVIAAVTLVGCPSGQQNAATMQPPEDAAADTPTAAGEAADGNANHEHGDATDAASAELSGEVVDGVRVVQMEAHRYEFVPDTIVVKAGEPVRLEVTATDVTHGLAIDALGIDEQLPPNVTQTIEFTADEPGQHHFHCSVYCGPGHEDMHGTLVIRE